VAAGSQVPVDGVIVSGASTLNESMLTGESMPVSKKSGDHVIGSTINIQGQILVKATNVGANTTLAKIVRLVEEAQTQKAPIQAMADKVSKFFVPVVITIAVVTFVIWFSLAASKALPAGYVPEDLNDVVFALLFCIAVLVIACPCALGLATPTAVMVSHLIRLILFGHVSNPPPAYFSLEGWNWSGCKVWCPDKGRGDLGEDIQADCHCVRQNGHPYPRETNCDRSVHVFQEPHAPGVCLPGSLPRGIVDSPSGQGNCGARQDLQCERLNACDKLD